MKRKILALFLALAMALSLLPTTALAEESPIPFADANFANAVCAVLGKPSGSDVYPSEAASLTLLDVSGKNIRDLTGIEYFTSLYSLYCGANQIESLELNQAHLYTLNCGNNRLTNLKLPASGQMRSLSCALNNLESLELSANVSLQSLDCADNNLERLDVSQNAMLKILSCDNNPLGELDVSKNAALEELTCESAGLRALDMGANPALKTLTCGNNALETLDVSQNILLENLNCENAELSSIDVSTLPELSDLRVRYNRLTAVDVTQNAKLSGLDFLGNLVAEIDLTQNVKLESLMCSMNKLDSLDVSRNPLLYNLACRGNSLSSLDVTQNPELMYLVCYDNNLTALDLRGSAKLLMLDCHNNYMPDKAALLGLNEAALTYGFTFYPQKTVPSYTLTLSEPCKTLVAGYQAYINLTVAGTGSTDGLLVALFDADTRISEPLAVVDGQARLHVSVPEDCGDTLRVGVYTGTSAPVAWDTIAIRHASGLWEPILSEQNGSVLVVFPETISLNAKGAASINGARAAISVNPDGKSLTLTGNLVSGDKLVLSGVKYPELFPSYSFTFNFRK